MKKFLVACLITAGYSSAAFSQTVPKYIIDSVTKKITYTEVVEQAGIKDTLYNRATHWAGIYFKNPQYITTQDKANGKLAGNYNIKLYEQPDKDNIKVYLGNVNFTFTIDVKDNKYRYKITDLKKVNTNPTFYCERWLDKTDKAYNSNWDYYFSEVDAYIQDFIKSMKKGMMEVTKTSDQW